MVNTDNMNDTSKLQNYDHTTAINEYVPATNQLDYDDNSPMDYRELAVTLIRWQAQDTTRMLVLNTDSDVIN